MILTSCDTMVALSAATSNGQTIFAKNSDRPTDECQPLVQRVRQAHAPGSTTRCQFVSLPEAPVTYRHIGSRPYWCWGYEHGVNEHQVVIGNEALHSRLPEAPEPRLIGMELIRLGLERARTAAEAVQVVTDLISRYGQGEFANDAGVRTYDNGYIVADPHEAYVLETAGRQWAVRHVNKAEGISNVYAIGADWERVSATAESDAVAAGWWPSGAGRLDWKGAFALSHRELDDAQAARAAAIASTPPMELGLSFLTWTAEGLAAYLSQQLHIEVTAEAAGAIQTLASATPRRARSCALLRQRIGAIDAKTMMSILSDHSTGQAFDEPFQTRVSLERPAICVHHLPDGSRGNTAASLIADLCSDGSRLPVYWCSFYSPCLGLFLPIFIEGELPAVLSVGGAERDVRSPWWQFHDLSRAARAKPETRIPAVRERWAPIQDELLLSAYEVAREGQQLFDEGREPESERLLSEYMAKNVKAMLATVGEMLAEFRSEPETAGRAC